MWEVPATTVPVIIRALVCISLDSVLCLEKKTPSISSLQKFALISTADILRKYEPFTVVENEIVKLVWNIPVQCDNTIEVRRLVIIIFQKEDIVGSST